MRVHWLYMSPGPYFRSPDTLLPPPRCSGSWKPRETQDPRTHQVSGHNAVSYWKRVPGEGLVGSPSLCGCPVLTLVAPSLSCSPPPHLHIVLGSPQDVLQGPQAAYIQAHYSPFSPDPLSPASQCLSQSRREPSASIAPPFSTSSWSLSPVVTNLRPPRITPSFPPASWRPGLCLDPRRRVIRPGWSQQLPLCPWLPWSTLSLEFPS